MAPNSPWKGCLFTIWELKQRRWSVALFPLSWDHAPLMMSVIDEERVQVLIWGYRWMLMSRQICKYGIYEWGGSNVPLTQARSELSQGICPLVLPTSSGLAQHGLAGSHRWSPSWRHWTWCPEKGKEDMQISLLPQPAYNQSTGGETGSWIMMV